MDRLLKARIEASNPDDRPASAAPPAAKQHAALTSSRPTTPTPGNAARRFSGVLGIPLWDKILVQTALELVDGVLATVPVYEATYPPVAGSAKWLIDTLLNEAAND